MKTVIQKISMLVLGLIVFATANAQVIQVSAPAFGFVIANNSSATYPFPVPQGSTFSITLNVANTGTSSLILDPTVTNCVTGCSYVAVSGDGLTDYIKNESGITSATIAPGGSANIVFTLATTAGIGMGKTLTFLLTSNATNAPTYRGTIVYTISTPTAIVKASDIGLTLFPNPSTDGNFKVTTNNVDVDRIVVSNVNGVTQEFTTKEFHTSLTGLLLVQMYTSKGVVSEKIIVE
jgi:hypothetical protein